MNWIEIFSTGTHTDSAGNTREFTPADLDRMVNTLEPARHEPPLVLGHPKTDAPAYGWVAALKRDGQKLLAAFRDVPAIVQEAVSKGRYKKRSISMYPDGRLRHVGLLGASVPAVQGLADIVAFAADDAEILDFTEETTPVTPMEENSMDPNGLEARVKALEAENKLLKAKAEGADSAKIAELETQLKELEEAKAKAEAAKVEAENAFAEAKKSAARKDLEVKIDALIANGRLLPRDKASAMAFAEGLASTGEMEFSEGAGKKPLRTHFLEFLGSLPSHGLTQEFSGPAPTDQSAAIPYGEIMNKV